MKELDDINNMSYNDSAEMTDNILLMLKRLSKSHHIFIRKTVRYVDSNSICIVLGSQSNQTITIQYKNGFLSLDGVIISDQYKRCGSVVAYMNRIRAVLFSSNLSKIKALNKELNMGIPDSKEIYSNSIKREGEIRFFNYSIYNGSGVEIGCVFSEIELLYFLLKIKNLNASGFQIRKFNIESGRFEFYDIMPNGKIKGFNPFEYMDKVGKALCGF